MKLSEYFRTIGKPFSYYPNLAIVLGSVKAAVLLCYVVWKDKDFQDGSTEKTEKAIQLETGLGPKEVKTAKELLSDLGIFELTYRRVDHFTEIKVNFEKLQEVLEAYTKSDGAIQVVAPSETDGEHMPNRNVAPSETELRSLSLEKRENKNENSQSTLVSPQPGGGSSQPFRTNFGFHEFISGYPKHRVNDKSKREARRTWNILTHENQQNAVVSLAAWRESSEWLKDDGLYVPNPANFLGGPRYNEIDPHRVYREECEKVRFHFTEVTGQANGFNKMSPERLDMLSRRFDEAVGMAPPGVDPQENAIALMFDAIDACWASSYYRSHADRISLESVFVTPEIFEKWAKREASP